MDIMYDAVLGRLRESGDNGGGGGSQYVKQMVYVTDDVTTNATLNFGGGTHLTFEQPLQGLTFASVEASHDESEIVFTAGTAFPEDNPIIPISVSIIGDLNIEAGKSYVVNIRDSMLVASEYTPGVSE